MIREIRTGGPVDGVFRVPGSKSLTNRALVCAALAQGESTIRNASDSDDSAFMANGLNQLGVLVRRSGADMIVGGTGGRLFAPKFPIPVGNAGTTLRFLLSVAAVAEGTTSLQGDERMAARPNDDLLSALMQQGIQIDWHPGTSRFDVRGGALAGGSVEVRSSRSSQFLSSLMLVAPCALRDTTLRVVEDLASAPYVLLTTEVMRAFGVEAKKGEAGTFTVRSGQRYVPAEYEVEPDASGASYPMAAAAIAGGRVFLPGVREDSLQGDARFTDVLRAMGCDIRAHDRGLTVLREGALRGTEVDMNGMPDVVPTLVAVALFAEGGTRILHVAHLRYKESDRGEGLAAELRKLGADVRMNGETMEVNPVPLRGARLDVHDDHRLAMSFALIGLRVPGVEIENPECVRKSFPEFWTEFDRLRPA